MTITHCWGVDPGFASSPTGVALVRFDALTPRLVGAWTIRPRGRDWQSRIDDVLGQLIPLLSVRLPRGPLLLSYELAYVVEGRLCQLGRDGVLRVVANEERRAA